MENNDDENCPIVIKQYSESVVAKYALFNWNLSTVRVAKGKVTESIKLSKGKYIFSCDLNLIGGDIIRIGNELETKYRILDAGTYDRSGVRSYRIKRLDGSSMTNLDITNSKKGTIVYLSTPSDKEIFELIDRI